MSRSVHTRPRHILASERMRSPYSPRSRADIRALYSAARLMKERGIVLEQMQPIAGRPPLPLPDIRMNRPRKGHFHPAGKADIYDVLCDLGEEYIYGLRGIWLAQAGGMPSAYGKLVLGKLCVPGRIILYEQVIPPWVLPGRLAAKDEERLLRAGAELELLGQDTQTVVHWPDTTLRDFMLFDVLMHELAHHALQQYTGKRSMRVARTKDHEAVADKLAYQALLGRRQHLSFENY